MNLLQFIKYQLFRPLSFLKVGFKGRCWLFYGIPCMLAAICVLPLIYYDASLFLGTDGIIASLNSILASLPGFFIAALAAVATFNKPEIDKELTPPIHIKISINNQIRSISISRRRLMCMLFSYLTFLSLFTSVVTTILLRIPTPLWATECWLFLGIGFYFFIVWQMLLVTLIGLFYLGERLHNNT